MFGSRWLPQTTCADRAPPEVQAIFFRRHHQPRRRPLVCALDSGTGDGLRAGVLAALFPVLRPVREQEAKLLRLCFIRSRSSCSLSRSKSPVSPRERLATALAAGLGASIEGALMTPSSKRRALSKVSGIFEDVLVIDEGEWRARSGLWLFRRASSRPACPSCHSRQ